MNDLPWIYVLPCIFIGAFVIGLIYKSLQDKTVEIVRNTLRPGDYHADDLKAYAAKMQKKRAPG